MELNDAVFDSVLEIDERLKQLQSDVSSLNSQYNFANILETNTLPQKFQRFAPPPPPQPVDDEEPPMP